MKRIAEYAIIATAAVVLALVGVSVAHGQPAQQCWINGAGLVQCAATCSPGQTCAARPVEHPRQAPPVEVPADAPLALALGALVVGIVGYDTLRRR
jgi:hypothetical protein